MGKTVFTIVYAGAKLPQFIAALKEQSVTLLVDVRSVPKSQYFPDFNDARLKEQLSKHGIKYENWKEEFGARQTNKEWFSGEVLDFEKFAASAQFKRGIERVKQSDEMICLMCAEIDPIGCHRGILCSKELCSIGIEVKHIIAKRNGEITIEYHSDLESRLTTMYCKQPSLLDDGLQFVYRKQNQKIGYNPNKK